MNCPECGTELAVNMVSRLQKESQVEFKFSPNPGELLNAGTVGGCIEQVGELLKAVAKDQGYRAEILVKNISTWADGAITVSLLITRFDGLKASAEAAE